jgi:photosystem II stability/assembly factor-like uncharacterized protein
MKNCRCLPILAGSALSILSNPTQAADPLATWHIRQKAVVAGSESYEGVAYGNGTWVVVGAGGSILTSPDGVTWTPEINPLAPKSLDDVLFAKGLFVAIGRNANVMLTSTDGHAWTPQTPNLSSAFEIIHDGTQFVIIAGGGFLYTSPDAIHWEFKASVPINYDIGGFAFGNGVYVEAGYKRTGQPPDLFSASDFSQWTKRDAKVTQNLHNVGFGLGMFVVVGQGGSILTSTDGVEWTPRPNAHSGFIWDVTTDGQHFVAAAQWGRLLTSSNGIDWTVHETDLLWHLTDVAFGKDTFVAVGWEKQIVQSDPVVVAPPPGKIQITNTARVGDQLSFQFTAEVGNSYEVLTSPDFKTWSLLKTVTATSASMPFTDANASTSPRFYRVNKP